MRPPNPRVKKQPLRQEHRTDLFLVTPLLRVAVTQLLLAPERRSGRETSAATILPTGSPPSRAIALGWHGRTYASAPSDRARGGRSRRRQLRKFRWLRSPPRHGRCPCQPLRPLDLQRRQRQAFPRAIQSPQRQALKPCRKSAAIRKALEASAD